MPRPRNAVPGRDLHLVIAEADAARLDLHLWSPAEQRIPHAARQKFFSERIKEFFWHKKLDLGLYFSDIPPGSFISGAPATIDRLHNKLAGYAAEAVANVQP